MDANGWLIVSIVGYSLAGILLVFAAILFIKMNILAIIGDLTGKTAARQIQEIREQNSKTGEKRFRPSAFNAERGFLTEPMSSRLGRSGKIGKTGQVVAHRSKRLNPSGQMEETESKRLDLGWMMEAAGTERGDLKGLMGGVPPSPAKASSPIYNGEEAAAFFTDKYDFSSKATVVLTDEADPQNAAKGSDETVLLNATTVLTSDADFSAATEVLTEESEFSAATTVLTGESDFSPPTEVLCNETDMLDRGTEVLTQSDETTVLYPTTELINEETETKTAVFKIVKDIKVIHTNEVI
jgi:hypothetical protein